MTWRQVRYIMYVLMMTVVIHYGVKIGWRGVQYMMQ